MATNFPASLDSLTNPTASDKLNSVTVPHATQHATLNDAVEALEAKVGVNGSAVTTSHDYLIDKQSVVPYDDASARTTAVPSPIEGQMSYLKDTNSVEVYNGSAWAAVGGGAGGTYIDHSASVTYSNFTLGNGTVTAAYTRIGDLVHYYGIITIGSTSTFPATPMAIETLPVTPALDFQPAGVCWFSNIGVSTVLGFARVSPTQVLLYALDETGGFVQPDNLDGSTPFGWGSGDIIRWAVTYRAA